jgi:PKD repeat protein/uncharacterized protein YraI
VPASVDFDQSYQPTNDVVVVVPTPAPGAPTVTANANANIHSGPGPQHPVIGILAQGQSAEAVGVSPDRAWWAIKYPSPVPSPVEGVTHGQGWVGAQFVTAENTQDVPVVQPPPAPAPTVAPPVVITEWKGEYFDNRNLEGEPALVRNDAQINFDWTGQSPAPEIPAENYSVRWTISRELPAGTYRFSVWVDDGVRMWVDEELVMDGWQEGAIQNFSVDVNLDQGTHQARVEYFQAVGTALIRLEIGSVEPPAERPPAAVISGPTQAEMGQPVTFDAGNSQSANPIVSYLWDFGDGATANAVTVDKTYSAVGVYNVTLTVVDDKGQGGSDAMQITIGEPLPGETPGIPPPEATLPLPEVTPPEEMPTAPSPEATTLPTEVLTPSPELTPTLGAGGGGTLTALIIAIVRDGSLQAIFTPGQAVVVAAGQPVEFDGSGSQAGTSQIVSYTWSFGDGGSAAEPVAGHTYAVAGTYTASLTVTDATGASNTATAEVQVYGEEPPTPETQ